MNVSFPVNPAEKIEDIEQFRFCPLKILLLYLASLFYCSQPVADETLSVNPNPGYAPYVAYENEAVFGYGPSPQNILTYLPAGNGNDYKAWVEWASKYKMSHVRSYPPSIVVKAPAINLFHQSPGDSSKFNLNRFNEAYFEELGRACRLMKEKGFFVHLQFWQAVAWKKQWDANYYNPANNINPDISEHAGPGEFMVLDNQKLLNHQKEYVQKILDATANLGNVYFDIANEIGNGTGGSVEWILEILQVIRQWEEKNNHRVLVTINGRGGNRVRNIEEVYGAIDLITRDVGRWEEHVNTQARYEKPTISVRNIDWDYEKSERTFFYGKFSLETNTDHELQTRGRKYWWRMFMAKVQLAGGYADAYDRSAQSLGYRIVNKARNLLGLEGKLVDFQPSYQLNTLSEENFFRFREFIDKIADYARLMPSKEIRLNHSAAHHYALQSDDELVIYLESPNGKSGYEYREKSVTISGLSINDGAYSTAIFFPESGELVEQGIQVRKGMASLTLPGFSDDLAVHIRRQNP